MNFFKKPKIAVLLAAYNGEKFISYQLDSILAQEYVEITIYISIDKSTDSTKKIVEDYIEKNSNIFLLCYGERFGNAGKNFYRLIKDVNIDDFEYIALADQDDYWMPCKLKNAINTLTRSSSTCYSSDVIAFWPDKNVKKPIKKSFPQKKFDYLFESGGPGCTYVLSKDFFKPLKLFIERNFLQIENFSMHDWLIYAFARSRKFKWSISSQADILYVQHGSNLVGANTGINAYIKRFKQLASGEWIDECEKLFDLITKETDKIYSNGFLNFSIRNFSQLRRRKIDCYILIIFLFLKFIKK